MQDDVKDHLKETKLTRALSTIPPPGLVLLSIVTIQLGAALAINLFPILGASGTVAIRIIISAILMGLAAGAAVKTFAHTFINNWKLLLVFGLCVAAMNLFFYMAIARIPLGAAVAIEFIGPLGVAAATSRRLYQFAWVALAALGIVLLSPLSGANLNTHGIIFALLAGSGWALFIILAARVGKRCPGNDGLTIAMIIAAITVIPFAAPVASDLIANPLILLAGFVIALFSTTIPFTLEFTALQRLPARTYGILVSMEPGLAALTGAIFLGERIGIKGIIAIACVSIAALGITLSDNNTSSDKPR